jgi:hypothetical protein
LLLVESGTQVGYQVVIKMSNDRTAKISMLMNNRRRQTRRVSSSNDFAHALFQFYFMFLKLFSVEDKKLRIIYIFKVFFFFFSTAINSTQLIAVAVASAILTKKNYKKNVRYKPKSGCSDKL